MRFLFYFARRIFKIFRIYRIILIVVLNHKTRTFVLIISRYVNKFHTSLLYLARVKRRAKTLFAVYAYIIQRQNCNLVTRFDYFFAFREKIVGKNVLFPTNLLFQIFFHFFFRRNGNLRAFSRTRHRCRQTAVFCRLDQIFAERQPRNQTTA